MNDKELIEKAESVVNDVSSVVAVIGVGVSLVKLGFQAGARFRDKEIVDDILSPDAMKQWVDSEPPPASESWKSCTNCTPRVACVLHKEEAANYYSHHMGD